ncbi:MAG: CapA family protein [Pyrinomonadaceae bacterium]
MSKKLFLSTYLLFFFAGVLLVALACQTKETKAETPGAENPQVKFTPSNNREPVTIAAVGDIMLGSTSINDSFLPPDDGRDMLREATPILSRADIAFGNLEGPMLEGGTSAKCQSLSNQKNSNPSPTPTPPEKNSPKPVVRCFAFRVPTRYGKYLKDAGFDVLNLANNHASDFGEMGRASTKKVLDDLGIKHSGSDKTDFAYLEVKGKKIAFVSFTHNNISLNINDLETARRVVAEQKKRADLVIVSFHGGAEGANYQHVPYATEIFVGEQRGNLRAFTHAVVDAGADLVLGHGPHVMRAMEIYKDRLIIYSMGNFATYGMFNLKGAQGLTEIVEITIDADGKFLSGKINAGKQIGRGIPVLDKTNESARVVRQLSQADFPTTAPKIADDGTISK